MDPSALGKLLILFGGILLLIGALLAFGARIPWLGRLPGDLSFGGENWQVYLPLGTSLLISVILTLVLWIFRRK
jgi:Protein of unknown function (DUF2905)